MSKTIAQLTLAFVIGSFLHFILSSATDLDITIIRVISIIAGVITVNQIIPND